jgi:uroporphyrinogen-III synthase
MVVFLTGAGVRALFEEVERMGRVKKLTRFLPAATLVSRGPKPAAALAKHGLRPAITTTPPHTTTELLGTLPESELAGARVTLIHYGERNGVFAEALAARGARVDDLLLYEWRLPDDLEPLQHLVEDIVGGALDIVAFTSQVQARHLFEVAGPRRQAALQDALNHRMLVGAIGPTCAEALVALGVHADVVPENPKLRPLLSALACSYSSRR